jgi:hypothetical protein
VGNVTKKKLVTLFVFEYKAMAKNIFLYIYKDTISRFKKKGHYFQEKND